MCIISKAMDKVGLTLRRTLFSFVKATRMNRITSYLQLMKCSTDSKHETEQQQTLQVATNVAHIPVLLDKVIEIFNPGPGKKYLDMTFGGGGHSQALLHLGCEVYGLDRDPISYDMGLKLKDIHGDKLHLMCGKFTDLDQLLVTARESPTTSHDSLIFDGVLFDVGCSSMQFDQADRGFSISKNHYLDMRMDQRSSDNSITAADVVNFLDMKDLARILKRYGEERYAMGIAQCICDTRAAYGPIKTTHQLVKIVSNVVHRYVMSGKLDRPSSVATKTFQAIRIFVNNELNELNHGISIAKDYLKVGGIMIAITFHSLEDRIVKSHFKYPNLEHLNHDIEHHKYRGHMMYHSQEETESLLDTPWEIINKHVITPEAAEVQSNPRSRSAKLRAARKRH